MNKKIPFANPHFLFSEDKNEILEKLSEFIEEGEYVLGSQVQDFETNIANFMGAKYAVGLNSGTDSIYLSLIALGIGVGDEVIVPSHTATATVAAICKAGASPVFADVESETYCIRPECIEELVNSSTRAVLVVHLYGIVARVQTILEIANKYNLKVIEDCAQAFGSFINNKSVGTFGDVGCLSFYPTKNLSTLGDAGAIVTNSFELFEKIIGLRQYGWNSKRESKTISGVYRMDALHAVILNLSLAKYNIRKKIRNKLAEQYFNNLSNSPIILPPKNSINFDIAYHLFVVRTTNRDSFREYLAKNDINSGIHYSLPVHMQHAFRKFRSCKHIDNTFQISNEILSLPFYVGLDEEDLHYICRVAMKYFYN